MTTALTQAVAEADRNEVIQIFATKIVAVNVANTNTI